MAKTIQRELLSAAGIVLTLVMFGPSIRTIQRNKTKRHVLSWVYLGLGTTVVYLAQLAGGGGLGAWPIGMSSLIAIYIAALSHLERLDVAITNTDWAFFLAALLALPCWFLTSDPLWAVIILTAVDIAGFGPTFRSAYVRPHDGRMGLFALGAVRNLIAILALEHYSATTVLFPAAVGIGCVALVVLLAYRQRTVACHQHKEAA